MNSNNQIVLDLASMATTLATTAGGKIVCALLVFLVGRVLVNWAVKAFANGKLFQKMEPSIKSFVHSLLKILLYLLLIIVDIEILGIPMTSVITVLASAGLAIGLALQGALSNFAGGLMILVFKPFTVGDYISAAGVEGTVGSVTVFYTILTTVDNKRVTVPNGTLMNANVVNFSSEELRRVDLVFKTAPEMDDNLVRACLRQTAENCAKVRKDQELFAAITGYGDNAVEYTLKAWCENEDYWDVYNELVAGVKAAFDQKGVKAPSTKLDVAVTK